MIRTIRTILLVVGGLLLAGLLALTVYVEVEAPYRLETLSEGEPRALVLYHPSRDARFSDEVSLALAEGLKEAGLSVDRATLTRRTPAAPQGYARIIVVSNTFYLTPDMPTLSYLKRAQLAGAPVVGVILGNGGTERAQRMLEAALRGAGADVVQMRAFWIMRPNDETRLHEPNRKVALDLARELGRQTGRSALAAAGRMEVSSER